MKLPLLAIALTGCTSMLPMTGSITDHMAHERKHAEGEGHGYW